MARWKGCKNKQCYEKGNRAIVAGGDTYSIVCLQFSTCAQRAMYNTEKSIRNSDSHVFLTSPD